MSCTCKNKPIKHTIVLQQLDANAYPLPNTAIPVKLSIYRGGESSRDSIP